MNYRTACILVFSLFAIRIVNAQDTTPGVSTVVNDLSVDKQKADIIRQIMRISNSQDVMNQVIDTQLPQTMRALRRNPLYPPALLDLMEIRLRERMKAVDVGDLAIPVYSKNFTSEELQQILAFDQSPTGQKAARLYSSMYSEIMTITKARGQEIGNQVIRDILAEHPEYIQQMQENRRKLLFQAPPPPPPTFAGPATAIQGRDRNMQPVSPTGNGVTPPRLISKKEPEYTPEAAKANLIGSVILSIVIDEKGIPQNVQVIRPLGLGLDEKAVEAVQQWRFRPATKDGRPLVTQANVEVNFHHTPGSSSQPK